MTKNKYLSSSHELIPDHTILAKENSQIFLLMAEILQFWM